MRTHTHCKLLSLALWEHSEQLPFGGNTRDGRRSVLRRRNREAMGIEDSLVVFDF